MCTIMNMVHPHIQISPESIKIYQKFTLCNIQIIPMIVEICKICTLWGEFDQRGGGVSIAAPLNPCFCPPLQLIMHTLD